MFQRQAPQYPKLRRKAAEIKWLAGPMLFVWEKYQNQNLESHQKIHAYLKLNLEIETMLSDYKENMAFEPAVADSFEHACTAMLLILTSVAEHFLEQKLFNLTQKAHFMQHISMLARYLLLD